MWTFNIPSGGRINLLFPTVTNTSTLCCFICRENWLLQNFRAAEKTENHPYTIICMHQNCRALGHLWSLNIPLSLLTLSKPSGSVLCSHLEMSHIEVIKSKGCIKNTGSFWTESCNARTPGFYIQALPSLHTERTKMPSVDAQVSHKANPLVSPRPPSHPQKCQHLVSNPPQHQAQEEQVLRSPVHRQTVSY